MSIATSRSLEERAARYRELAARAEAAAAHGQTEGLRAGWQKIARDWAELALEVERRLQTPECGLEVESSLNAIPPASMVQALRP